MRKEVTAKDLPADLKLEQLNSVRWSGRNSNAKVSGSGTGDLVSREGTAVFNPNDQRSVRSSLKKPKGQGEADEEGGEKAEDKQFGFKEPRWTGAKKSAREIARAAMKSK